VRPTSPEDAGTPRRLSDREAEEVTTPDHHGDVAQRAAITKESAERLELAVGKDVVAIIKATDVMIGVR
jgi:ABC-type molybdate transport system ATPase subunit